MMYEFKYFVNLYTSYDLRMCLSFIPNLLFHVTFLFLPFLASLIFFPLSLNFTIFITSGLSSSYYVGYQESLSDLAREKPCASTTSIFLRKYHHSDSLILTWPFLSILCPRIECAAHFFPYYPTHQFSDQE